MKKENKILKIRKRIRTPIAKPTIVIKDKKKELSKTHCRNAVD